MSEEREKYNELNRRAYGSSEKAAMFEDPNVKLMARLAVVKALQFQRPVGVTADEIYTTKCEQVFEIGNDEVLGAIHTPIDRINRDAWSSDARVLDFACGVGAISTELLPNIGSVVGLDISDEMVKLYNERVNGAGEAILADILEDGAELGKFGLFDAAICSMSFHHMPDVELATKRVAAMLKSGGWFAVLDFDGSGFHHDHGHDHHHHHDHDHHHHHDHDHGHHEHDKHHDHHKSDHAAVKHGVAHQSFEFDTIAKCFQTCLTNVSVEKNITLNMWLSDPKMIKSFLSPEQLSKAITRERNGRIEYLRPMKLALTIGQKP